MPLSTEIFVMFIFVVGFPFYVALLKDPHLGEGRWFLAAYGCLVLSNVFTVVEEFWFPYLFNLCEHLFITLSAALFILAILRLTPNPNTKSDPISDLEPALKTDPRPGSGLESDLASGKGLASEKGSLNP